MTVKEIIAKHSGSPELEKDLKELVESVPCENWTWRHVSLVSAMMENHEKKKAKSDGIDEQIDKIKKWQKETLGV